MTALRSPEVAEVYGVAFVRGFVTALALTALVAGLAWAVFGTSLFGPVLVVAPASALLARIAWVTREEAR